MLDRYVPNVKRVQCGQIVKFTLSSHESAPPVMQRLNSDYYIDGQGFLQKYRRSEVKGENIDSVKRTFARLRDLINCNAIDKSKVLFITLTYDPKKLKSELTTKKLSNDVRKFFRRLRDTGLCFEHIYVVEKQGNGRWHAHVLLFCQCKPPFMSNEYLESLWHWGYVKVSKRFQEDGIKNIGAYICADLTFSGDAKNAHKAEKDSRLLNYRSGLHLYRCSPGIKRPTVTRPDYSEYLQEIECLDKPIFETEKVLSFGDGSAPRYYLYQHYVDTNYFE